MTRIVSCYCVVTEAVCHLYLRITAIIKPAIELQSAFAIGYFNLAVIVPIIDQHSLSLVALTNFSIRLYAYVSTEAHAYLRMLVDA